MIEVMYIVIMISPDGDNYKILNDEHTAREVFDAEKETEFYSRVVMAKVTPGKDFGFGSYGDFYGGEVLEETEDTDI